MRIIDIKSEVLMKDFILDSFTESHRVLHDFLTEDNILAVEKLANMLIQAFQNKKKVIICGNGGSNCDAMHFSEELTGKFRKDRIPLPSIAISDSSHITCVGNDYGFEDIFSRGVEAYGHENDVFIGISTSGNSKNVYRAVEKASELKLLTVGLLGMDGGTIKDICHHAVVVKANTTDRIQEMHIKILHIVIEMVERKLFPDNY